MFNNILGEVTIDFDTSKPAFRLSIHELVMNEAKKLLTINNFPFSNVIQSFEAMGKAIINNKAINKNYLISNTVYIHNAIFQTGYRSKNLSTGCNCTPFSLYFTGKSEFWCLEDIRYSPSELLSYFDSINYQWTTRDTEAKNFLLKRRASTELTLDSLYYVLEPRGHLLTKIAIIYERNNSGESLKYNNDLVSSTKNSLSEEALNRLLQGTDLGCCGNYSGVCWYSSLLCLAHDLACLKCDKWHCGPACQPF